MHGLSSETKNLISELAGRYQISEGAVLAMLTAVKRGHGTMAQFDIGELGGNGQWMRGGMTMVGDMFNHGLKQTVDNLCNTLAQALASGRIDLPGDATGQGGSWWPQWLGNPSSTGGQNDSAYAVFPTQHCLAIRDGSGITIYDTQDHMITGVGQQQGSSGSLTFNSQRGSFSVASLRRLDHADDANAQGALPSGDLGQGLRDNPFQSQTQSFGGPGIAQDYPSASVYQTEATGFVPAVAASSAISGGDQRADVAPAIQAAPEAPSAPPAAAPLAPPAVDAFQIVALIEKLAALHSAGILSESEFAAKKAELLARL